MTPLLPSLGSTAENVLAHLRQGHDTALIAAPGSGATTLTRHIAAELRGDGVDVISLDFRTPILAEKASAALQTLPSAAPADRPGVALIDHAASLPAAQLAALLERVSAAAAGGRATCLWVGPLDARAIAAQTGRRIYAVPRSHISFPMLPRDELLAVYRSIGQGAGCNWGEAILFLLLDLCGNDLSLIQGVSDFLYGDWTSRLYDVNIWDRINAWLKDDPAVNQYRRRLGDLPQRCREYLALLRLGGKPPCPRPEVLEEVDDALRQLWLQGLLAPNLLPGFYQLRNLTVRLLIYESTEPWNGFGPEFLFRRSTNERVGQLLQDVETMLRGVLLAVFHRLGAEQVETLLKGKQSDRDFMPADLNKSLLGWAEQQGGAEGKASLNRLLVQHRLAFKEGNSIWAKTQGMMAADILPDGVESAPVHLRCLDFLTFNELSVLLIDLLDDVFPSVPEGIEKNRLRERWRENMAKVQRLRNRVAHLRNVEFRDLEGLVGMVEGMRNDLLAYAGWR